MSYPRIISKVFNDPWCIDAATHSAMRDAVLKADLEKIELKDSRLESMRDRATGESLLYEKRGNIAIIEVSGIISKRISSLEAMCGGQDLNSILHGLHQATEDPEVEKIVMDFDSPGGTITGLQEAAAEINQAKLKKPVYAYTETMSASAAYWLMSQCSYIIAAPSSRVGSVGIYSFYEDPKQEGELIKAGKYKAIGIKKLSREEREMLQSQVEKIHVQFKTTVSSTRKNIKESDMEGQVFTGEEGIENGMVDLLVNNYDEMIEAITYSA